MTFPPRLQAVALELRTFLAFEGFGVESDPLREYALQEAYQKWVGPEGVGVAIRDERHGISRLGVLLSRVIVLDQVGLHPAVEWVDFWAKEIGLVLPEIIQHRARDDRGFPEAEARRLGRRLRETFGPGEVLLLLFHRRLRDEEGAKPKS